jgi:hypothetical protein
MMVGAMAKTNSRFRSAVSVLLLMLVTSCGGGAGEYSGRESPAGADADDASAGAAPASAVTLTTDTLAAYERGLRREIEAVRAAQQLAASATDPEQRSQAMQAQWETATIPQGAQASGLDEARYRDVREAVNEVFQTLDFQGTIDGPLSMDLSRADEATRTRLARDPFDDLTPESAAALRAEMGRLAPIWMEYVTLTAVAG